MIAIKTSNTEEWLNGMQLLQNGLEPNTDTPFQRPGRSAGML